MSTSSPRPAPAPLVVAVSLSAIEAVALLCYGLLELFHLSSERLSMGLTTALFFAAYAVFLAWCTRSLWHGDSFGRSPVVFSQLMVLGLAWSFRGGETTVVAVGLAVVAVIVLAGVLHPASMAYLADEDDEQAA